MCGRFTMLSFDEMLEVARLVEREIRAHQLVLPLSDAADAPVGVAAPTPEDTLFPDLEPVARDAFPGSIVPVVVALPDKGSAVAPPPCGAGGGGAVAGSAATSLLFEEDGGSAFEGPAAVPLPPGESGGVASASAGGSQGEANRPTLQVVNLNWGFRVPWNKGPVFNARIETATSSDRTLWGDALQRRRCLVATRGFFEPSSTETVVNPRTGRSVKRQYRFTIPDEDLLFLAAIYEGSSFSVLTCEPNRWVAPVHPRMPIALRPAEAPMWLSHDYAQLFDRSDLRLSAI